MERHRSQPYNPNIANGFFRAGYVETWGRGIEKICEACKEHGVRLPEYTLHMEDIMIKLEENILSAIRKNSKVTQSQIALEIDCSERKVKRLMKSMQEKGMIERVGGRRSGEWVEK